MSWQDCPEASTTKGITDTSAIAHVITPKSRDLGGFSVKRALPVAKCHSVGPFVFFDEMGPTTFAPDQGIDVRAHPHIGLATLTWLLEGEIVHRDSLGTHNTIRAGEVNWMTAGSGIVHSERSPADRSTVRSLHGLQIWMALPADHQEVAPDFQHYSKDQIPCTYHQGVSITLVAGQAWGMTSPVNVYSPTLYGDVTLESGAELDLNCDYQERAVYVLAGTIGLAGQTFGPATMVVLTPGQEITILAASDSRIMVLGGAPLDGPRHMWWNFVSTSLERIEKAKKDWAEQRFAPVPGETERIELPDM